MDHAANDYRAVSVRLSCVLGDVGVNQDMVLRRRRMNILQETLNTISCRVAGYDINVYIFGSQTEGTTSPGLDSDIDQLICNNDVDIIQDWGDWQYGKDNLLIIRDDTTGPGYCHLQQLRPDVPLPVTQLPDTAARRYYTRDSSGRILYKNTESHDQMELVVRNLIGIDGPAGCRDQGQGFRKSDNIIAYPCHTWPYEAQPWLIKRRRHWPPLNLLQQAENAGCFVVPKGQKQSEHRYVEWRISTSLAERMLMFSFNITQIQCYYSLKLIIKTFINNLIESSISSYHCKTVMFYCIEQTSPELWCGEQLFVCIRHCLQQLRTYVIAGHLPNYFIPEDNLIAERCHSVTRNKIVDILNTLLKWHGEFLCLIQIDDIGLRLLKSFNIIQAVNIMSLCPGICDELAVNMYHQIANMIELILYKSTSSFSRFRRTIIWLTSLARLGTTFQQSAARYLLPTLCSSLGSMIAAADISRERDLSPAVMALFRYGVQSDAASSRLKFASILYCRGEFRAAALLLRAIEGRCGRSEVQPISRCYVLPINWQQIKAQFKTNSFNAQNKHFRQNVSYCVIFLPSERPCVPLDLRYEMFRSFGDDVQYRDPYFDYWMDWAVIDSLPFLHYLQYLVYRQLGSRDQQQQALYNLTTDIMQEHNLGHRETALNLLGKCLEQDNRFNEAYVCYTLSLRIRPRNNAANFHLTYLIYRLHRLYRLLTGI